MRVLLVEDETFVSLLIEEMLIDLGHTVVGPASTVAGAIALADRCDVAILDVNLGAENSFPIADELVRLNKRFVFSSGYENVEQRFAHVPKLMKPFSEDMLATALSKLTLKMA